MVLVGYPFCKLCQKKIANRKELFTQHKNHWTTKEVKNEVAGVGRLNFPGLINLSLLKLEK